MDYVVVIEKASDGGYSAYVPDWAGCVSCGETLAEAKEMIEEAVRLHLESLRDHGEPVPLPSALAHSVPA